MFLYLTGNKKESAYRRHVPGKMEIPLTGTNPAPILKDEAIVFKSISAVLKKNLHRSHGRHYYAFVFRYLIA